MPLELPIPWVITLNAGGLPALQLGLAWIFTWLPLAWFQRDAVPSEQARSRWYESVLQIKRWKRLVPDGASWFSGGFAKAALRDRDHSHLTRFVAETRRGEACHWTALLIGPVFLLWNPLWADLVMMAALMVANLPCIAIQRYNRQRFLRVLAKSV